MNQFKKNNGWILCPSKSFPGKFYYFNVLNGEAAWCLNEADNKTLKRDCSIQRIADKSHCYPEPSSPPIDESPNTSTSTPQILKKPNFNPLPCRIINNTQVPMFGQATFPKYVEPYIPNIIWTPIQVPSIMQQNPMMPQQMLPQTPMLSQSTYPQNMYMNHTPEARKKTYNHNMSSEPARAFVQTCNITLSKRFTNYTKQAKNTPEKGNFFKKFFQTSTPVNYKNKSSIDTHNHQMFGSFENLNIEQSKLTSASMFQRPMFKRVRTQSENDDRFQIKNNIKSNSLESLLDCDNSVQKCTFMPGSKVENCTFNRHKDDSIQISNSIHTAKNSIRTANASIQTSKDIKDKSNELGDLDKNDLRYLLVAKRKSVDLDEVDDANRFEGKKIKTSKTESVLPPAPKKKVTFDLGVGDVSDDEDDDVNIGETGDMPSLECEVSLTEDTYDNIVYVVVDIDTLLEDLQFIEEYVQADDKRRLVISHELKAELEAACLGDCGGRQRVIVARQMVRKLVAPPHFYVLLPEAEHDENEITLENYTLNCCLDVINGDDELILITNNTDLYNEAKSLQINCLSTQEIKDGPGTTKPEISFDLQKVQNIGIDNSKPKKNINTRNNENDYEIYERKDRNVVNKEDNCINLENSNKIKDKNCEESINKSARNKEEIAVNNESDFANSNKKHSQNPFLHSDPFTIKIQIPGKVSKTPVFKQTVNLQENTKIVKDANTSPINTDKLIDITRKKISKNQKTIDYKNLGVEIGLENLFIKEKQTANDKFSSINDKFKSLNDIFIKVKTSRRENLSSLNEKFSSQNDKVSSLNEKFSSLNEKISSKNDKVSSVNEKFCSANDKVSTLNEKFSSLNEKFSSLNEKVSSVDDKVSFINEQEEPIAEKLKHSEKQKPIIRFENGIPLLEFPNQKKNIEGEEKRIFLNNIFGIFQNDFRNPEVVELLKDYPLNECLDMFCIEDDKMDKLIDIRMEEFVCTFSQIMENVLVELLSRISPITDRLSPPWVLYEATKKIEQLYGCRTELKNITETFRELLLKGSSKIGNLKSSMKPDDFMKIFGCGVFLVQVLKAVLPPYEELEEAAGLLNGLINSFSQQVEDLPKFQTPVLTRCDVEEEPLNRQNFVKKRSDIIAYLKAHYPDWKDVEEIPDHDLVKKNETKVLRTVGRDLNLLKINNTKAISFKKSATVPHNDNPSENAQNIEKNNQIVTITSQNVCEILPSSTKATYFEDLHGNTNKEPIVDIRKFDSSFDNLKIIRKVANDHLLTEDMKVATPISIDDLNVPKHGNTFNEANETAGPKVIRKFANLFLSKSENKSKQFSHNFVEDTQKANHGCTFQENGTAGPKTMTRQHTQEFETKSKDYPIILDLDALDYSGIDENLSPEIVDITDSTEVISVDETVSFVYKIKDIKRNKTTKNQINNDIIENNDNALDNDITNYVATKSALNNDSFVNDMALNNDNGFLINGSAANNDDSVLNNCSSALINDSPDKVVIINDSIDGSANDSGFENESLHARSLVKTFLSELSSSFKTIYQFIDKTIIEFKEDELQEEKRQLLRSQANTTHLLIAKIIDKLKSIIQRESSEGTALKKMLIKAGVHASTDKRMTRYRQVVTKCLEQAQMLEHALKKMLSLSEDDFDTLSVTSAHSDIRYFNIYE